jgi:hypothetical protein
MRMRYWDAAGALLIAYIATAAAGSEEGGDRDTQ